MTTQDKITNTLNSLQNIELMNFVFSLKDKFDDGSAFMFETGLSILENRLSEKDFINFCEQI